MIKSKLIRITTVPQSLKGLLQGQLKFMNSHYNVIGISSGGEALDDVKKAEGISIYEVEMTGKISPFKDLIALWKLYVIFRKENPQIVHTHTPKAGILGMVAAKLAGVPHRLHTVAGMPLLVANGRKRKLLNGVEKLTYACATKIYPNSFGLCDIILKGKFTSINKLKVLGNGSSNGIDTTFFDPKIIDEIEKKRIRESLKILSNDFVFIFVGRIVKDKGVNELVAAFIKINEKYSNTKLLLVGNFERHLDPLLSQTEREINSCPSILTLGYQSDVRPYYAIADVLTFPSYREGFPNVVMQACAMSLNSIVTDINGCNEIIIDGENGLIIPVKNADVLYERMEYLYLNQVDNQRMAQNSRARICAKYERSFVWQEILKEYQLITNSEIGANNYFK